MRENIIIHMDAKGQLDLLSDTDRGRLFSALFAAAADEEIPPLSPEAKMALAFLMQRMRYDTEKYERKCAQNREKAKIRWQKNMQQHAVACNGMDTDTDTDTDIDTDTDTDTDTLLSAPSGRARAKKEATIAPAVEKSFADFYTAYPKKVSKPAAKQAYLRALGKGATAKEIMTGLSRAKGADPRFLGEARYIPTAKNWLDSEGYHDEHPSPARLGNFDTDEFFEKAVKRSYENFKKKEEAKAASEKKGENL